jgi:hypothetical protein
LKLRFAALLVVAACGGADPHEKVKPPPCPPPPEPDHQAVVVGTIGKYHLAETRYPLAKLAEAMAVFKPDLVLVGVRVDPYRENKLEDASFEMTYVTAIAKERGAAVEPIDWFALGKAEPPVDPADEQGIEQRETEILHGSKLFTFEQANASEMSEHVLEAWDSRARHRSGDAPNAQRRGWLQHLTADAVTRQSRPKKVMAFVDVLDRPAVDAVLGNVGYALRTPVDLLAKSKETAANDAIPEPVVTQWRAEATRAEANASKSKDAEAAFWTERAKVLAIAVEKRGTCCVTSSALGR